MRAEIECSLQSLQSSIPVFTLMHINIIVQWLEQTVCSLFNSAIHGHAPTQGTVRRCDIICNSYRSLLQAMSRMRLLWYTRNK